jgi:hypothetical protein
MNQLMREPAGRRDPELDQPVERYGNIGGGRGGTSPW